MPLSLIFIFPFVQMLLASFMTTAEINAYPPSLFPQHPTLDAYRTVLQDSDFTTWFKNSLIVTTVAVISQLLLCPLAGYAFARMKFIGTRTLQLLLLTTVFIPPQLLMIPVYRMYSTLGIVGTLPSLFLPWMATAISIFLMRQFFVRLPREIEEAAMIDGCGRLGTVRARAAAADAPRARHGRAADGAERLERLPLAADLDQRREQLHAAARTADLSGRSTTPSGPPSWRRT